MRIADRKSLISKAPPTVATDQEGSAISYLPSANALHPARRTRYTRAVAKYQDLIGDETSLLATTGRAWVFGDDVTRQQVLADQYVAETAAAASTHVMAGLDEYFAQRVRSGEFLVAGLNFAGDAAPYIVPLALKQLGLAAVIARSFGTMFLRHATNVGLPALMVEETAAIKTGDSLRVDVEAHVVANLSSGDRYVIRNIDEQALAILRAKA